MDINLLVINVGNSRLALGSFVAGSLEYVSRIGNDDQINWPRQIAEAWSRISGRPQSAIAGASVNPAAAELLEPLVRQATGQDIQWVGQELDLPIPVLTDAPAETGVDRILNIAAAYEQMQKACVVVDAGTAVTVDCCDDNGNFLGGAIAPGAAMMLRALHQQTARLPQVNFAIPDGAFGKSTAQAMCQGAYHGIRGLVKELVESYATALGNWPEVICTGGDATTLFEGWELVHAIAPDLTLYGIALAYAEHHIRHKT